MQNRNPNAFHMPDALLGFIYIYSIPTTLEGMCYSHCTDEEPKFRQEISKYLFHDDTGENLDFYLGV